MDTDTVPRGTLIERAMREVAFGPEGAGRTEDKTRTKLLDAAYEQFCETGIARASMEEVARRAGTARITIYRKFDSKDDLVDAVMLREFERYLRQFVANLAGAATVEERIITGFVTSLRTIGSNPLIMRLMAIEPAAVPGLVGGGDQRTMLQVRDFVAVQLQREQQAGNIASHISTLLAADMMVRISGSLLTSPSDLFKFDDEVALVDVARQFILPLVGLDGGR